VQRDAGNTGRAMTAEFLPPIDWRVAARLPSSGGAGGGCVEVGPLLDGSGRVALRHGGHPEIGIIIYSHQEWQAFIRGVKDGEFDFL
jgi:hypothetical protein